MTKSYRAALQMSLHDAPNPLDPIGATDWGRTRASAFVDVDVELTDQTVTRSSDTTVHAVRTLDDGAVWALFVDRWGAGKPVCWAPVGQAVNEGAPFTLAAGSDRLSIGDSFSIRNVATSSGHPTSDRTR
ncbi:MAG: hypothetical protein NVS3B21_02070 [Acidimicrobiales bacterium]